MSIVDAVQSMLEKDGSLLKIRAQLKSNVVNVLKDRADLSTKLHGNAAVEEYIRDENEEKGKRNKQQLYNQHHGDGVTRIKRAHSFEYIFLSVPISNPHSSLTPTPFFSFTHLAHRTGQAQCGGRLPEVSGAGEHTISVPRRVRHRQH